MKGPILTIDRFVQERQPGHASGEFTNLLYDLALAAKLIASKTIRAGLIDILGDSGVINVQGEHQKKLDVFADEAIVKICNHTGRLCVMASEERENVIPIPESYQKGSYALVFDPLDGSSNIDVNVGVGTIFGIHRCVDWHKRGRLEDVLQKGSKLVAAGYVFYGSSTMLVYSTGQGVHAFTLNPELGEFILSNESLSFPEPPQYCSLNNARRWSWDARVREFADWLHGRDGDSPELSSRYAGALVADFHRNLLKGGIYGYPAEKGLEQGKLRLVYEAAPLAFLAEQAGGAASNGRRRILDLQPEALHQRTPLFIGNRHLVERAERLLRESQSG